MAARRDFFDLWQNHRSQAPALALKLPVHLFEQPVIGSPAFAKHLGVTARTANLNIAKLMRAGLIQEANGRKRGRLYLAAGIMDARTLL